VAEAQRLAHPPFVAVSSSIGARLLALVGDNAALAERAKQLVAVATEQGFPHWRGGGNHLSRLVIGQTRGVTRGASVLCSGLAAYRATGAALWMPQYIAFVAEACEIAGKIEESLTLLDEALHIVERTGERWFAAELHRHKGELQLRQGHTDAAEGLY